MADGPKRHSATPSGVDSSTTRLALLRRRGKLRTGAPAGPTGARARRRRTARRPQTWLDEAAARAPATTSRWIRPDQDPAGGCREPNGRAGRSGGHGRGRRGPTNSSSSSLICRRRPTIRRYPWRSARWRTVSTWRPTVSTRRLACSTRSPGWRPRRSSWKPKATRRPPSRWRESVASTRAQADAMNPEIPEVDPRILAAEPCVDLDDRAGGDRDGSGVCRSRSRRAGGYRDGAGVCRSRSRRAGGDRNGSAHGRPWSVTPSSSRWHRYARIRYRWRTAPTSYESGESSFMYEGARSSESAASVHAADSDDGAAW